MLGISRSRQVRAPQRPALPQLWHASYLMTGTSNDVRRHDVRGVGICCVSRAYRFVLLSIEAESLACSRAQA